MWTRHLLNCASLAPLIRHAAGVCDVGSGAGLPGMVVAVMRPDLHVTLLEPMLRRSTFLEETVAALDLPRVTVVRGRAEELAGSVGYDVVTARAVAPLGRLVDWTMPLLLPGGELLALKGEGAAAELERDAPSLARLGARSWAVEAVGDGAGATSVVRVVRGAGGPGRPGGRR